MSTDRKVEEVEVVSTSPEGDYEHREKVVEDTGAARRKNIQRFVQSIWLLCGVLEAFLGLRFFFLIIAANPSSPFARMVYDFTDLFMWPFTGLTHSPSLDGRILEIPAIIAMFSYALLAWALVGIVEILFASPYSRKVTVYERRRE